MSKPCIWCGKQFEPKYEHRLYCSHRCYMAFFRANPTVKERKRAENIHNDFNEHDDWTPPPPMKVNGRPMPRSESDWRKLSKSTQLKLMKRPDAIRVTNDKQFLTPEA